MVVAVVVVAVVVAVVAAVVVAAVAVAVAVAMVKRRERRAERRPAVVLGCTAVGVTASYIVPHAKWGRDASRADFGTEGSEPTDPLATATAACLTRTTDLQHRSSN